MRRCDACLEALLFSPETALRRALVDEPDQSRDVLVALTTDNSGAVALAASRRLELLDAASGDLEPGAEAEARAAAAMTPLETLPSERTQPDQAGDEIVVAKTVKARAKRGHGSERNVWP